MSDSAASAARLRIRASTRRPSRRRRSAKFGLTTAILTGICLWQAATTERARAAGLSADSDILGLRITMQPDQIKTLIQQQFGTSSFVPKTIKLGTPDYTRDVALGFSADILTADEKAANQKRMDELNREAEQKRAAGCNSALCQVVLSGIIKDSITVYADPSAGSSRVLALVRQAEYPKDSSTILQTVFLQSLTEKFGQPSWSDHVQNYAWAVGATGPNGVFQCAQFADGVGDMEHRFPMIMNSFASPGSTKRPACTTYLKVTVWAVPHIGLGGGDFNTKYVSIFSMALVNVEESYSALSGYAREFWAAAAKAKRGNLSIQSQNKPRL